MTSQLNVPEFGQALGDGEGQGSLACCSPWGHRESDMTEKLQNNKGILSARTQNKPRACTCVNSLLYVTSTYMTNLTNSCNTP